MKVLKRNFEHRNLIIFLIFSLIYLQSIYSLSQGQSVLNLLAVHSFFGNHFFIIMVTLVTIYAVINVKKHSDKILLLCLSMITGKTFILLAASFNKLILGLNFIYLIFAFYFYVIWELEMAKASYNPLFAKNDLEKSTRFKLRGHIQDEKGGSFEILITNIDQNSCFAMINSPGPLELISHLKADGVYRLIAEYEGVKFTHLAEPTSTYDQGIGLNFIKEKEPITLLNWSDLYQVCLERGFFD